MAVPPETWEQVVQGADTAEGDNAQRDPDVTMEWDGIVFEISTGHSLSAIGLGRYR